MHLLTFKKKVFAPNQFFSETQAVIGHFDVCKIHHPKVSFHKHCNGKTLKVGFSGFIVEFVLGLANNSLELNALNFTNNACFENYTSGHENIMACLLNVFSIEIRCENKTILLLKVNIETVSTPGLFVKAGGQCKHVVLVNKINYTFLGQVAHCISVCVTKVKKKRKKAEKLKESNLQP